MLPNLHLLLAEAKNAKTLCCVECRENMNFKTTDFLKVFHYNPSYDIYLNHHMSHNNYKFQSN